MSLIFKHTVTLLVDLEMLLLSLHALHDNNILIILKSLSILFGIKFLSLRKQVTFGDTTTGFPAKWCLRNEHRNFILMTRHYPDLGSASDWLNQISQAARQIRRTNQIWVVMHHQYGISALVSQTSFGGECSGSIAKCQLFSHAKSSLV